MLFLSVSMVSQHSAPSLLNNKALFHQECLHDFHCLVLEHNVVVVLCCHTFFFFLNHQHARVVKMFMVKGFCRIFYHAKTEITSWTASCNCIESSHFHGVIVFHFDVIMENLATEMR